MTAPLLLNALQIAWMRLLQSEAITDENIKTARSKSLLPYCKRLRLARAMHAHWPMP
jgi:hypothetical protein